MYHLELAEDENTMPLLFEPRKQLVQEYQLARVSYKVLLDGSAQHMDVGSNAYFVAYRTAYFQNRNPIWSTHLSPGFPSKAYWAKKYD